ncbi:cytochrome b/b6 domain-containing protein [Roseibacterium sp. SDUM158017]|uniref:cytochrome b/b6 domain-containing protein n=1 Tax=Roseicyclus salinarum TaxID=3036773 RepID=UPI0024156A5F|nr:cytochrome b/b6 domain-containing protein [Roseibacterium sp. SDUM158017]MDG4650454.1 cytochrome b/b6 domain-containing protein [Roseibacterium sp. SDUM158017]
MMETAGPRRAWDPLVRITHWGIAAVVILNGLILEGGEQGHIVAGYVALSLLALRLVWGIVGTEEARFGAFPPSPRAAIAHVREIATVTATTHRSHNPLGALMVYTMWAALAVVIATGLAMEADVFPEGRGDDAVVVPQEVQGAQVVLADGDDEDRGEEDGEGGGETLEEVHEAAANLMLMLALLHVGGVVFEMARGDRGLIRRMTTGSDDGQNA